MSAFRACRPRLLRLDLSTRYQSLRRRAESTASNIAPSKTSSQPPPNPGLFRRYRSAITWGTLSLTLGVVGGQFVVHTVAPPAFPEVGTREDGILMADLNSRIDEQFKVKVLRGKCLGVTKQLKGEEGGWFEVLPIPMEFSESTSTEEGLVAQMQGAKGLGVERVFWDRGEGKLVAVIWFGGSLCGWPGVTHGGALAIAMAEKLSLAAALASKSSNDTLAAATPQRLPGTGNHAKMLGPATTPDEPAQMSIGYLKPTYANQFYVLRVRPALPTDDISKLTPEPYGGAEYEATLETQDGTACVKARAKFAPSTTTRRTEETVVEGANSSYQDFKEWMWPSRQKQSQTG